MRISDWSSDVCSSDLNSPLRPSPSKAGVLAVSLSPQWLDELRARVTLSTLIGKTVKVQKAGREYKACCPFHNEKTPSFTINRSEEHTSELQSLMRISYAVFCLKQKINSRLTTQPQPHSATTHIPF